MTSYVVLIARSVNGVKIALEPLHVMLDDAIRPRLTSLSRKLFLLIVLHIIGSLKVTVTVVLTGTSTWSSAGVVLITVGP
jgi:hypothetical protein